jgi:hypothetical protein
MAITYEWFFDKFETDENNKVKVIFWRYKAVDGKFYAEMYNSCGSSIEVNLDTITKEDCINSVLHDHETTLEEMQSNLLKQIEFKKNPTKNIFKTKNF